MVVGEAEGGSHTTKLENYFVVPLALRMPIYSNFQINGASGETRKPPDRVSLLEIAINQHQ